MSNSGDPMDQIRFEMEQGFGDLSPATLDILKRWDENPDLFADVVPATSPEIDPEEITETVTRLLGRAATTGTNN